MMTTFIRMSNASVRALGIVLCGLGACSCSVGRSKRPAGPPRRLVGNARVPSPSGKFAYRKVTYVEVEYGLNWPLVSAEILDSGGRVVFETTERLAGWFSLKFGWDESDRLWVNSSDAGVYFWERTDGRWSRYVWEKNGPHEKDEGKYMRDTTAGTKIYIRGGVFPANLGVPGSPRRSSASGDASRRNAAPDRATGDD